MENKSVLLTPLKIGSVKIPNRFVRSATQDFMATNDGNITDKHVAPFKELAKKRRARSIGR